MNIAQALGLLALVAAVPGCAKPAQLGGLGVFNPRGFEGRVALAGQYAEGHGSPELQSCTEPTNGNAKACAGQGR